MFAINRVWYRLVSWIHPATCPLFNEPRSIVGSTLSCLLLWLCGAPPSTFFFAFRVSVCIILSGLDSFLSLLSWGRRWLSSLWYRFVDFVSCFWFCGVSHRHMHYVVRINIFFITIIILYIPEFPLLFTLRQPLFICPVYSLFPNCLMTCLPTFWWSILHWFVSPCTPSLNLPAIVQSYSPCLFYFPHIPHTSILL